MLHGEKITLRPIERDDLKQFHRLEQGVDLVTLADGDWKPYSLEAMEKRYDSRHENTQREYTSFVIEAEGRIIGDTNLHHLDRLHGTAALGIAIYEPDCVGKGYGRDAIRTLLRWAFENQNWRRIWLETIAVNERAIRAYRACGFIEEARLRQAAFYEGGFVDIVVMGVLRSEWEAHQRSPG
jgi:diamine N-acetyltransferase